MKKLLLFLIPFLLAATTIEENDKQDLEKADTIGRFVVVAKADGIVNPVMSEFLSKGIEEATQQGAEAFIIELDTPGGLDLAMRDIIKSILSSEIPVVVYVSPGGARAASAGVFITIAAHVAAMAPGTNIGAAHPVAVGGGKMDETMVKKVENDAVAYIRGIANKMGKNADWAEKAVRESVSISAEEALKLNVIDIVTPTLQKLLSDINNRKVELITGEKVLNTENVEIKPMEMGWRHRILDAISNPNVAYILMMIGLAGLYFELSNPGAIVPGVIGGICLILAFYAFQTLPINYAGFLLIMLAIVLFIMEVKVVSYGLLSVAGIVSLTLGSLMLIDSPEAYMRVSLSVILPTVIIISGVFIFAISFAFKAAMSKPLSGEEGLIGEIGVAETPISPEGRIFIHGEIWKAESEVSIKKKEKVEVVKVEGLMVKVKKVDKT
ncbi:MAG: nodulation protein NfeD [Thermodesulfobacteriota bacterium]